MIRDATFSKDKKNRYLLKRQWDFSKDLILYIMLNPSIADEKKDDPTIRRLINFTKKFDFGGFYVANIFTEISSDPKSINKSKPISKKNKEIILSLAALSKNVVYAWGNSEEEPKFLKIKIDKPKCFGKNKDGSPKHPLYLSKEICLQDYR